MQNKTESKTSYEDTIKTLLHTQRGAFSDLDYVPAFRASAIFFALADENRTTHISFLNYWREKNQITSISALLSLRDDKGHLKARTFFTLDQMTYQIDVRDLLNILDQETSCFVGTLEIEFHSSQDLKFPFPALLVFYETPKGISYVHTNQRTYNDPLDRGRGDPFNPNQTGFDVSCHDGENPFVFIANGSESVSNAIAKLRIYNSEGMEIDREINLGDLSPFSACRLDVGEIDGVREFLSEGVGFLKLNLPLGNVYNRFACGIESPSGDWLGITHSYFDCLRHDDYYSDDYFPSDIYHCFVPVNLVEDLITEVVFYPIIAPTLLSLKLAYFDANGSERALIELTDTFDTSGTEQIRIDLRKILSEHKIDIKNGLCVIFVEPKNGKLPTRISFGLNYRYQGLPGCNISSSSLMASSHGVKSRSWLWGALPCRSGARNIILISYMPKEKFESSRAIYTLSIYNKDTEICSQKYELGPRTSENIVAEDLISEFHYVPEKDEILWYVLRSECSSLVSNQIHVSADGYIGGDHSF